MLKPLRLSSSISGIEVTDADRISGRDVAWSDESEMVASAVGKTVPTVRMVDIESKKRQRLSLKSNCCSQKVLVAEGRNEDVLMRSARNRVRAESRKAEAEKKNFRTVQPFNSCTTPLFSLGAFPSQLFSVFFSEL